MDAYRAQEIIDSLGVIEVRYHGSPVWMEQVVEDRVQIQNLNTLKRYQVQVGDLVERWGL